MNSSAVIYLLNNHPKDINNFRKSISLLIDNYHKNFPCDIVCFYEEDFPPQEIELIKTVFKNIPIYFEPIKFKIPDYSKKILTQIPEYFPHPDFPHAQGFSIGYRHMCRFFAGEIFKHNKLSKYRYIWRLDTDSFILSPISYNVFNRLDEKKAVYGYINIQNDHPGVVHNLWELSSNYFKQINKGHIFKPDIIDAHRNRVFYTNFEIFDMEWFKGNDYQNFYNFIDNTGGIYVYRWGDHSIRYIALNSLLEKEQLYFFNDIRYYHQQQYFNNEKS